MTGKNLSPYDVQLQALHAKAVGAAKSGTGSAALNADPLVQAQVKAGKMNAMKPKNPAVTEMTSQAVKKPIVQKPTGASQTNPNPPGGSTVLPAVPAPQGQAGADKQGSGTVPNNPSVPANPTVRTNPVVPSPDQQDKVQAAQQSYLATLVPDADAAKVQSEMDRISEQGRKEAADLGGQRGVLGPVINAQQQALLNMTAAQEAPLTDRLAAMQASNAQRQARAKAELDLATPQTESVAAGTTVIDKATGKPVYSSPEKPMNVPAGSSMVDPNTGKVVATSAATQGVLTVKDIAAIAATSSDPTATMKALMPYVGKSAQEAGLALNSSADPNFDALKKSNIGTGVQITPEAQQLIGQIYATTGSMPYIRTQAQADAIDMAAKGAIAQGKTPADVISNQTDYKADAASQKKLQATADATHMNEKKAEGAANIVLGINDQVWRTASPLLNARVLFVTGKAFGDPATQNLANAVQTLTTEYGKVIANAAGNSELSVGAQKSAEERISAAQSPEALISTVNLMKQEMANSAKAIDSQLAEIKGRINTSGQKPTDNSSSVQSGAWDW